MKRILITAGLHADEINAMFVAFQLKGYLESKNYDNVDVIPLVNKTAFNIKKRKQNDNLDLNRSFPGNSEKKGTLKLADRIYNIAKKYDVVIDLHNYSNYRTCLPFFLTDLKKDRNKNLAQKIGMKYAVQTSKTRGQLFVELSEREGISTGIIEFSGSYKHNKKYHDFVYKKLINFIENERNNIDESNKDNVFMLDHYEKIRSKHEGKLKILPNLESSVKKGELIAKIGHNDIFSPYEGVVIAKLEKENYFKKDKHFIAIAEI